MPKPEARSLKRTPMPLDSAKTLLLALPLTVSLAGSALPQCPAEGDLDNDCDVDIHDVAIFAGQPIFPRN
jgi:hypothetical protein